MERVRERGKDEMRSRDEGETRAERRRQRDDGETRAKRRGKEMRANTREIEITRERERK